MRSNTVWTRTSRVVLLIRDSGVTATMCAMTEPPHRAVIARLSADFASISQQLTRVSADLTELDRLLSAQPAAQPAARQPVAAQPVAPQPAPYGPPATPYWPHYPPQYPPHYPPQYAAPYPAPAPSPAVPRPPVPPPVPPMPRPERTEGWIGKVLAVAGVAVTLIGVVLLLVLAAQAGILRPEFRVAGGVCSPSHWWPLVHGFTRGQEDASVRSRWPRPAWRRPTWTSSRSRRSTNGCPHRPGWSSRRSSAAAA